MLWIISIVVYFVVYFPCHGEASNCSAPISLEDYNSLFALYNSCDGPNWRWNPKYPNSTHWNFPSSLIHVVTCGRGLHALQVRILSAAWLLKSISILRNCGTNFLKRLEILLAWNYWTCHTMN